jgi:hypothetical protein
VPRRADSEGWGPRDSFGIEHAELDRVCQALYQEIVQLRTAYSGSPSRVGVAAGDLREGDQFGGWLTARGLRATHLGAADGVLAIYNAITSNLMAALKTLKASNDNYLRAEVAVRSSLVGHPDADSSFITDLQLGAVLHKGRGSIQLPISPSSQAEHVSAYDPYDIRSWLTELRISGANDAHYSMARAYRAAADRLDELTSRICEMTRRLEAAWPGNAAMHAVEKLTLIADTTRNLGGYSWQLSSATEISANALHATFAASLRAMDPSVSADGTWHRILAELNKCYRDSIDQCPTVLEYDLPFGGPAPIAQPAPAHEPEPTVGKWPFVRDVGGVIGGTSNPPAQPSHYTDLPESDAPPTGIIG